MSDAMQNNAAQNAEVQTRLNSPSAVLNPEDNKSDATPWIIFVVGCIAAFLMASALLNIASAALAWKRSDLFSFSCPDSVPVL